MIIEYLRKNGIEAELIKRLLDLACEKEYPVGSTILSMGENTKKVSFIKKGLVRGFYINDEGEEITKCFSDAGTWCCVHNILSDAPSEFWVEALEHCVMIQFDTDRLRKMVDAVPEFQRFYAKLWKDAFLENEQRSVNFQKMKAKERYLVFVEQRPDLERRIKQEYIASYIGITPSSLSRIKRDL